MVALTSDDPVINIYHLAEMIYRKGWHLSNRLFRPCVHMCLTMVHTKCGVIDRLLRNLVEHSSANRRLPQSQNSCVEAVI